MGGHGGLNILPQKRWNVYNRDNRLKVSQDEAKAAAVEAEERARAEQAEREFRYARLQKRALGQDLGALEPAAAPALQIEAAQQADNQLAVAQPLEHVNFWKEDELKMKAQHPEVEAEKKNEPRKRGNPDMYTSDPRFDERFQLGYQMKGEQPWWAKTTPRGSSAPDPQALQAITAQPPAAPAPAQPQLPASGTLLLQQHGSEGRGKEGRSRRRGADGRQPRVEAGDSEQVAAAKQLLRQVLGDQVDALIASSSSSDSDSDTSGSSSGSESSSDSDGGGGRGHARHKRSGKRKESSRRPPRSKSRKKRRRDGSSGDDDSSDSGDSDRDRQRSKKRHKSSGKDRSKIRKDKSKRKHKSKERHKERSSKSKVVVGLPGVKSIEQLRAERMEREIAERKRERLVLVGALGGPATCEAAGYNSGFGHAAALKKSRGH